MTEIGLNPQEAAGTMAKLAGQFDSAGSTLPQAARLAWMRGLPTRSETKSQVPTRR